MSRAHEHRPGPIGPLFGDPEQENARALIDMAVREDLGTEGDLTARLTIPAQTRGVARIVARAQGVLCGTPVVELLAQRMEVDYWPYEPWETAMIDSLDPDEASPGPHEGSRLECHDPIGYVRGTVRAILAFERTALNFLQRLSGVATLTHRFVDAVRGTSAVILDTRKTTPGWRILEKYAVRCGGGQNHRIGLYEGVLIKDNHLAWLAATGDPIGAAVAAARQGAPPGTVVEIEVDELDQLDRALECRPDIILLDNFARGDLAEAVRRRDKCDAGILLEASGGVSLATVRGIAETGVDRISVGSLTHSAPALDIALDEIPAP
jgi:nicotinate-nucleotide pyrophosphorylase (carboxylating)